MAIYYSGNLGSKVISKIARCAGDLGIVYNNYTYVAPLRARNYCER